MGPPPRFPLAAATTEALKDTAPAGTTCSELARVVPKEGAVIWEAGGSTPVQESSSSPWASPKQNYQQFGQKGQEPGEVGSGANSGNQPTPDFPSHL